MNELSIFNQRVNQTLRNELSDGNGERSECKEVIKDTASLIIIIELEVPTLS